MYAGTFRDWGQLPAKAHIAHARALEDAPDFEGLAIHGFSLWQLGCIMAPFLRKAKGGHVN